MRHLLPYAPPGQRVGLLGGSFDPAHMGHVHVSRQALMRFDLDAVWWLVSPGNPLKEKGPASLDARVNWAQRLVCDPRIKITTIEKTFGTRYTVDTLGQLKNKFPRVKFTWLMGADNLAQLHLWRDWRQIVHMMPMGVLARPGARMQARNSVAARVFASSRLLPKAAHQLADTGAPAWSFVNIPMRAASSTLIRSRGDWP